MCEPGNDTLFIASHDAPSRAAEGIDDTENGQLLAGLESIVLPQLARAAADLKSKGFQIIKLDRLAALARLIVTDSPAGVDGWLYFQIHRTFGPMLNCERLFWMYSVCRDGHSEDGQPGRLQNLYDVAAIREVVDNFTSVCATSVAGGILETPAKSK